MGLSHDFAVDKAGDLVIRSKTCHTSGEIKIRDIIERARSPPYLSRAPLILRFDGILQSSMSRIHDSFRAAMEEQNYPGPFENMFQYMYPIKVCYEASVMDKVLEYGEKFDIGLEAGSSAEYALAVHKVAVSGRKMSLLFDGYKEDSDLKLTMDAERVGCRTILVLGDLDQLRSTIRFAKESKWRPQIALRIRLQTSGAGRWAKSCGTDSKFGLTLRELARAQKLLAEASMLHDLRMIHFHPGSQVTRRAQIEQAVEQGIQTYIWLRRTGADRLSGMNCGGGLAAESQGGSISESTTDYNLQEYADSVVRPAVESCAAAGMIPPKIIIESGRALVAQHAMLVVEVLGVRLGERDTCQASESCGSDHRSRLHREAGVDTDGSDVATCGFSIFRSLMDYFVEGRTFQFMPIERLFEQPEHFVRIADISADSDGEIDRFPGGKTRLAIHKQTEQPYYLAVPFVGAYQHALGCSHNLFGTVTEVDIPPMTGPLAGSDISVRPGSTVAEEIDRHGHIVKPNAFLRQYFSRGTYPELDSREHKL